MPLSMTRSDLQQLPDEAFKAWAVRYNWEDNSFHAGPAKLKKEQDKLYDTDGTTYGFDQTAYVDGLRIFHSDNYELVVFEQQKDFLKGLSLFSKIIAGALFDSAEGPGSGIDELHTLLDGISKLVSLAEVAIGGQVTLDVASTKALATPTEKWVLEMGGEPWTIHHAGVSDVAYGADTLSSSESGKVYSEYDKLEEGFVLWGNIHQEVICVFEDETDFAKGLKLWSVLFAAEHEQAPPEFKALLAKYN